MAMRLGKKIALTSYLLIILLQTTAAQTGAVYTSLQLNDRNFKPGVLIRFDLQLQSESSEPLELAIPLEIRTESDSLVWNSMIHIELAPNAQFTAPLMVNAPAVTGAYRLTIKDEKSLPAQPKPEVWFYVVDPLKPPLLSKILVTVPEGENELHDFVERWDIEAPSISWGQIVLCSSLTLRRYLDGDKTIIDLINRALRRSMSVVFLDFQPFSAEGTPERIALPLGFAVAPGMRVKNPAAITRAHADLSYNLPMREISRLNGLDGLLTHEQSFMVQGDEKLIKPLAQLNDGEWPNPVVKLSSTSKNGTIVLSGLITKGRINPPDGGASNATAYDPVAEQLLLNLIVSAVDDKLLKK